jgi:hypothetical protein
MQMTAAGRPARWRRAGMAAWGLWALTMVVLAGAAWLDRLLHQAGRPDLDTLTAQLLAVADQTMPPTSLSLWLRPSVGADRAVTRFSTVCLSLDGTAVRSRRLRGPGRRDWRSPPSKEAFP